MKRLTSRTKKKISQERPGWLKSVFLTAKDVCSIIGVLAIIVAAIAWGAWVVAEHDHELETYVNKFTIDMQNMQTLGDRFCGTHGMRLAYYDPVGFQFGENGNLTAIVCEGNETYRSFELVS